MAQTFVSPRDADTAGRFGERVDSFSFARIVQVAWILLRTLDHLDKVQPHDPASWRM